MKRPLATASGAIGLVPLVLLDLETDQGITGRSYVFPVTPMASKPTAQLIQEMLPAVKGDNVAPFNLEQKLQKRFRLLGLQGLVYVALSAMGLTSSSWSWRSAAPIPGAFAPARYPSGPPL